MCAWHEVPSQISPRSGLSRDGIRALHGFKPPKRENSRLLLDDQLLCLLGFAGSIARALGSVLMVRPFRCSGIDRARLVLLRF